VKRLHLPRARRPPHLHQHFRALPRQRLASRAQVPVGFIPFLKAPVAICSTLALVMSHICRWAIFLVNGRRIIIRVKNTNVFYFILPWIKYFLDRLVLAIQFLILWLWYAYRRSLLHVVNMNEQYSVSVQHHLNLNLLTYFSAQTFQCPSDNGSFPIPGA